MPKQPWERNTRHYKRERLQEINKGVRQRQQRIQRKYGPPITLQLLELFHTDREKLCEVISESNTALTFGGVKNGVQIGVWCYQRGTCRELPTDGLKIVSYRNYKDDLATHHLGFCTSRLRWDRNIYLITHVYHGIIYLSCGKRRIFKTLNGPDIDLYGVEELLTLPCLSLHTPDETYVPVNPIGIVTIK